MIPTKQKLVNILYNAELKSEYYATTSTQEQQIFLQQILNAAPNLQQLEIRDDNFPPPLRGHDNLKSFKFVYTLRERGNIDLTGFQNLTQFLEKVKLSLERLELNVGMAKFPQYFDFDQFKDKFHLPRDGLPKLTSFINGGTRLFKCTIPEVRRMDKLKKLDLCANPDVTNRRPNYFVGGIVTPTHCWRNVTDLRYC